MPLDTTSFQPEPSVLLRLLRRGRDRIKKGWVKNSAIRRTQRKGKVAYNYCMLGALSYGDSGDAYLPADYRDASVKAIHLVDEKIHTKYFRALGGIPSFNDSHHTTHKMVMDVLDEVVADQEQRERERALTAQ